MICNKTGGRDATGRECGVISKHILYFFRKVDCTFYFTKNGTFTFTKNCTSKVTYYMWPKQCGRRKQVCGHRRSAEDINSLARLEPMNKVGEMTDACGRLLTDTAFILTALFKIPYNKKGIRFDTDSQIVYYYFIIASFLFMSYISYASNRCTELWLLQYISCYIWQFNLIVGSHLSSYENWTILL